MDAHLSLLESLPLELQLYIVEELEYADLKRLQQASKHMHSLVATSTSTLDKALFRVTFDPQALRESRLEKRRPLLELHPVLQRLEMNLTTKFTNVRSRRNRGFFSLGQAPRLADMGDILNENATYPPAKSIKFDSNIDHECFGENNEEERSDLRDDEIVGGVCTKPHTIKSEDGAVTVEQFVKSFLASISRRCYMYGSEEHEDWKPKMSWLEGWRTTSLTLDDQGGGFGKPIWEARGLEYSDEEDFW